MGLFKRHKVWWMSFSYQGRQIRRTTGTTDRRLAESILAKIKVKLIEGQYFDRLEEQVRTVEEMMDRYHRERVIGRSRHGERRARAMLKHLLPIFGQMTLAQVTPKELAAYKWRRLQEKAAPATIVKELAFLKAAFNMAIREWEWCRDNPVRRVSMGKVNNARVRYCDDQTLAQIYQACPGWLQPIVMVARYTGLRRDNVVSLQWNQVDLARGLIVLDHTKNGDRLGIPLCEPVIKTLEAVKPSRPYADGPVFLQRNGDPVTGDMVTIAFRRACRAVGVADFRFHDLRHTFASALVQRGVDLYRVQRLLGHRDGRMTQRYAHLAPENLREAVQVFKDDYHKISTGSMLDTHPI
ncbi:putative Phage integrase [Nitrospira tepida]|uniref:Phage integrase n=1 Tax=Nitrospira tepida TaxID=2973512 RepID=A0AA86T893_9BACT|nr:site-specific integrase [Nitrospira tepida]CAI4033496.1 putative Phage integrase [Nitrospira tepida]